MERGIKSNKFRRKRFFYFKKEVLAQRAWRSQQKKGNKSGEGAHGESEGKKRNETEWLGEGCDLYQLFQGLNSREAEASERKRWQEHVGDLNMKGNSLELKVALGIRKVRTAAQKKKGREK